MWAAPASASVGPPLFGHRRQPQLVDHQKQNHLPQCPRGHWGPSRAGASGYSNQILTDSWPDGWGTPVGQQAEQAAQPVDTPPHPNCPHGMGDVLRRNRLTEIAVATLATAISLSVDTPLGTGSAALR